MDFFGVVQDEVNKIAYMTGEIAGYAIEEQGKRVVLYRSEGSGAVGDRIPIGEHTHLHWTSLGKAIMAYLPDERLEEIIDNHGLPEGTSSTITDKKELESELESIRTAKFAVDDSERRRGVRGVAVPILDAEQEIVGSVGVAGPQARFSDTYVERLLDILTKKRNVIEVRNDFYR
jgi:DNA-binding IclR family transcriptional regulator